MPDDITPTKIIDIKTGDQFIHDGQVWWTACEDAKIISGQVRLLVRHRDGGTGVRAWDSPDLRLTVRHAS